MMAHRYFKEFSNRLENSDMLMVATSLVNLRNAFENSIYPINTITQFDGTLRLIAEKNYDELYPSLERFIATTITENYKEKEVFIALAFAYYLMIGHATLDTQRMLGDLLKITSRYPDCTAMRVIAAASIDKISCKRK